MAEQFADGLASAEELEQANQRATAIITAAIEPADLASWVADAMIQASLGAQK